MRRLIAAGRGSVSLTQAPLRNHSSGAFQFILNQPMFRHFNAETLSQLRDLSGAKSETEVPKPRQFSFAGNATAPAKAGIVPERQRGGLSLLSKIAAGLSENVGCAVSSCCGRIAAQFISRFFYRLVGHRQSGVFALFPAPRHIWGKRQ